MSIPTHFAILAHYSRMRQAPKKRAKTDVHSGGLGEEEGWRKRTHGTEEGLRVELRRIPRE
jgi:cell wall-associated NlpC family hydrolase